MSVVTKTMPDKTGAGFDARFWDTGAGLSPMPVISDTSGNPIPWNDPSEITSASIEARLATGNANLGDLAEAAPATDTASSGLNGRLQRIAQRLTSAIALLTSMVAQLPASLGIKTAANSMSIAPASDAVFAVSNSTGLATLASRILSAAASTNGTSAKASAGTLKNIAGYNARTSAVYLKLYNKASAPTVGTDTPVLTLYLPASTGFVFDFSFSFATGIAYALTTGSADADTGAVAAGDILGLNVMYV